MMLRNGIARPGMALLFATALAACGGDDDDAGVECESFNPCGGDPVGTWIFGDVCLDVDVADFDAPGECPQTSLAVSDTRAGGTLTIDEDGTYSLEATLTAELQLTQPQTCLPQGASCEELDGIEDVSVECSTSGSNCLCTFASDLGTSEEIGTWDVSGSSVTLDGDAADFCVEGDMLTLRFQSEDATATYVLNRM